ncbi:MAG: cache domain-containing protein, partial [Rhodoferax sp.]|nr:cache domain-containing protein [Rhodoferax sp.]
YLSYSAYGDYQRTKREELARLAQQAAVVESTLVPQLKAANLSLLSLIEDLPRWQQESDFRLRINRRLQVLNDLVPGVRTVLVVDAQGEILAASNPSVVGSRAPAQQQWFRRAQENNAPQTLYLTPPYQSLVSATSVALVRSMVNSKGEFDGAVYAALHPEFAKILLSSVVYTPDTLSSLVHANGTVFASTDDSLVGKDVGIPGSLFSRHRDSGQTTSTHIGMATLAGLDRIIAQRTIALSDLGMSSYLVVAVARNFEAVFAPWRRGAALAAGMFAALVLAAIGGLALYQYVRMRNAAEKLLADSALAQSQRRFTAAFAAAPIAASIARLKDGCFIEANRNYERLFGWTRQEIIGKSSVELGVWPDAATRAPWAKAMQQHGELVDYETVWMHKNGQRRHVSISAALTDVDGGVSHLGVRHRHQCPQTGRRNHQHLGLL